MAELSAIEYFPVVAIVAIVGLVAELLEGGGRERRLRAMGLMGVDATRRR